MVQVVILEKYARANGLSSIRYDQVKKKNLKLYIKEKIIKGKVPKKGLIFFIYTEKW